MFKHMLSLCFVCLLVACSSDEPVIEKKSSKPDHPEEEPELIEEVNGDEKVSFIEFSLLDEQIKINLNMVPILNDYIEASASTEDAIQKMNIERVHDTNQKLYVLSFSCNDDLCSYILLDRNNGKQAILLADIASLVQITPSPDDSRLLVEFERKTSSPLPLTDIIVIDTEKWEKLKLENETNDMDLLDFTWPLLGAEWSEDDHIRISKPEIDEPTEKHILEWEGSDQPTTDILFLVD